MYGFYKTENRKLKHLCLIFVGVLFVSILMLIEPSMATTEITTNRDISDQTIHPGDIISVNLTLEANQDINPPLLNESIPESWVVTRGSDDAQAFKNPSDGYVRWVWLSGMTVGDKKTVVYYVEVPEDEEIGTYNINGFIMTNEINRIDIQGESEVTVNEKEIPVANFTSNVTEGEAPLTIKFTDLSRNATEWFWDFGDGNVSNEQSPFHVYYEVGGYTVIQIVSNANGTDSKVGHISVKEPEEPILPVANFTSNVTEGEAPLTIKFTDLSENVILWHWDFGDGNISNEQSPVHVYYASGNYRVNLTVSNPNGTDSKISSITVLEKNEPIDQKIDGDSTGSGGSGGGGAVSSEPASNIEIKELSPQQFIANGKCIKFDFPRNTTIVCYVGFEAKKSLGKIITVVEMLKNKSGLTPKIPEGKVYRYMNIWVGKGGIATSENIGNSLVGFRVNKEWIKEYGIEANSITLFHFIDKQWILLPTNKTGEDEKYLYFEAETQGFGSFAVTGGKRLIEYQESDLEEKEIHSSVPAKNESKEKEKRDIPGISIVTNLAILLIISLYFENRRK